MTIDTNYRTGGGPHAVECFVQIYFDQHCSDGERGLLTNAGGKVEYATGEEIPWALFGFGHPSQAMQ